MVAWPDPFIGSGSLKGEPYVSRQVPTFFAGIQSSNTTPSHREPIKNWKPMKAKRVSDLKYSSSRSVRGTSLSIIRMKGIRDLISIDIRPPNTCNRYHRNKTTIILLISISLISLRRQRSTDAVEDDRRSDGETWYRLTPLLRGINSSWKEI